jgi:glycosyltransferase involved in cell wall biosynthesis
MSRIISPVRPFSQFTPRIAAWPQKGTPYTECFYEALTKRGVSVIDGDLSIRWIMKHVKSIDYLHFHWPSFAYAYRNDLGKTFHALLKFLLFLAIAKINGKEILWTAHNLYPHDKGRWISTAIDAMVRHLITRIARIIFVHGPTARELLSAEFPHAKGKITVIDHGHFIHFYENQSNKLLARRKVELPVNTYVFLFIGICKKYKNIPELIRAFNQVTGDVMLLVAGNFPDESYLREITDMVKGQESRIRIVAKHIPDDELQFYLNACDAVVLPYSEILTSGAAMLAISFGRPVIAPDKGYLKDVIKQDCGILYKAEDPHGLVNALVEVQKVSFSERNIINHALTYDWERIADLVFKQIAKDYVIRQPLIKRMT